MLLLIVQMSLLGEEVVELAPLVVEGRHFDEVALELPMGVKRLEREEISRSGAGSVPEVLSRMAGIRFIDTTGNGTTGQVAMRGFGDNSGLRVLVIVDGQIYNPPDMGGINWQGIDLDELETVEVLRGGQTVLYGNHAVAGVIKLTTRKAGEQGEGRLLVGTGSDGLKNVRASVGGKIASTGIRGGGSWMESDGYRDHASIQAKTGFLSWSNRESGTTNWTGRFQYNSTEMELPGPLLFEEMLTDPRQAKEGVSDIVSGDEWQLTQHAEGKGAWGDWEASAGMIKREREWDLDGRSADNNLKRGTFNPRVKIDLDNGYLIGGTDLSMDQVDYTGYWAETRETILSWAEIERITAGGYVFGLRDLTDELKISGGIRIESANTDNEHVHFEESQLFPELETNRGTIPNPDYENPPDPDPELSFTGPVDKSGWAGELSLLWQTAENTSIWCGWDRVYRYPTLDETASYQGYPLSDPLNSDLEPETGNNYEVGIKHIRRNWQLGITGYYLYLNDEISFVEYDDGNTNGVIRLNQNIGNTERKGIELDFMYQSDRYGTSITASFADVSLDSGTGNSVLPLVPEREASLTVWAKPLQEIRIQVQGRYQSSQVQGNDFSMNGRLIPSYWIANTSLFWDVTDRCDISVGINNLFDKTYAMSAYSGGFYPGSGRQGYMRIKFTF